MKAWIAILVFGISAQVFAATVKTAEVQVGISGVYIPSGFDSGSDAFVVVNGLFQNGCYSWNRAEVKSDTDFEHSVKTFATVRQGICTMALVPFTEEVQLGQLKSGVHTLKFDNGDGTHQEKLMTID